MTPAQIAALPRPLAFVLPGGGALGSNQVGVLRALTEAGITADQLVGVSAGSVNATLFAWNSGLDGLLRVEAIWRHPAPRSPASAPREAGARVRRAPDVFSR